MTNEFGKLEDQDGQNNDEGTTFGDDDNSNQGITAEDLAALRTRDAAAQAHIPDLESENKDLRDKVVELESKVASATNLDEVLERITNRGEGTTTEVDAGTVTQIVDQVLDQRQTQSMQESNWNSVMQTLTTTYGDWKTADAKVQERAQELDIPLEDATTMAKNNPKAFLTLFETKPASTDGSAGVRSAGSGQQTVASPATGETRDKAFWQKTRRENPKYYWSLEGQAAYRRDIHPDL